MIRTTTSIILLLAVASVGQAPRDRDDANAKNTPPNDGFWPTDTMMRSFLGRFADDEIDKYELSDEQVDAYEARLMDRWPAFLNEHRADIQPLLNEFIEARIAKEPPGEDSVSDWAERALPMFDLFEEQLLETQRDLEPILNAKQKIELIGESVKMAAGLQAFRAKLEQWQRGEYAENEWWDPPRRVRRQRRRERELERDRLEAIKKAEEEAEKNRGRVSEELDRWDKFVAEFVVRFQLDDPQKESAYSILRECKQRAEAHRDRVRDRMKKLDDQLADKQEMDDEQKALFAELYGPVDALFAEMSSRLDQIPTAEQREIAERAAREKAAGEDKAGSESPESPPKP